MKIVLTNRSVENSFNWINSPSILLWPFKPDNLLHLFHDDLIPLFATLKDICNDESCMNNKNLVFLDNEPLFNYKHWYSFFSKYPTINLSNQNLCFRDLHVGLKQSFWYQYGFNEYHGPVAKPQITSSLIREFSDFIKKRLIKQNNREKIILKSLLITRTFSRKILNEKRVKEYIEEIYKGEVKVFQSEDNNLKMVEKIFDTELLIGMHGAEMAIAIFLPINSTVIELFPYGIDYKHVSAIYALSILPEMHFHYFPWTNMNRSASITRPDYPQLLGGIQHLSKEEQKWIQTQDHVPPVKCCHDANYLFHMFQDTYIDSSLKKTIHKALYNKNNNYNTKKNEDIFNHWYFPGPVYNVSCLISNDELHIKWYPPINYISKLVYFISLANGNKQWSLKSEQCFMTMNISSFLTNTLQIWISSEGEGAYSIDEYKECQLLKNT